MRESTFHPFTRKSGLYQARKVECFDDIWKHVPEISLYQVWLCIIASFICLTNGYWLLYPVFGWSYKSSCFIQICLILFVSLKNVMYIPEFTCNDLCTSQNCSKVPPDFINLYKSQSDQCKIGISNVTYRL